MYMGCQVDKQAGARQLLLQFFATKAICLHNWNEVVSHDARQILCCP